MKTLSEELLDYEQRKQAINSKVKGNNFERTCAKLIGDWCGFKMERVPYSGSLRWQSATHLIGDITPSDTTIDFPFTIECKFYKKYSKADIIKFYTQAEHDAIRAGKLPMLIVRYNKMKADEFYVWLPYFDSRIPFDSVINQDTFVIIKYTNTELFPKVTYQELANFIKNNQQ